VVAHSVDQLNRPMRDLRISVMDRCNFRCPYCMPKDTYGEGYRFLGANERLSFGEITRLAAIFVRLGVHKVRLTGGEPLLRAGLSELIGDLAAIDGVKDVALTTNGVLLKKYAEDLHAQGLSRVTVSLDSLDPTVFKIMSGGMGDPQEVLSGIHAALEAGLTPVKINCVVERGLNEDAPLQLIEAFRHQNVCIRFIEYMDVGNRNHWQLDRVVPSQELHNRIHATHALEPLEPLYPGEVANRYRLQDGSLEVGFISSVTQPFCGGCTRARLSSDGVFYTCLFATEGLDLKSPLRDGATDDELTSLIQSRWLNRQDRYSELRAGPNFKGRKKIEMYYIGG